MLADYHWKEMKVMSKEQAEREIEKMAYGLAVYVKENAELKRKLEEAENRVTIHEIYCDRETGEKFAFNRIVELETKLAVCVEALKYYSSKDCYDDPDMGYMAEQAIREVGEDKR